MEEILDLYEQPADPQRPVVCFDEASKELHADVRAALPVAPGQWCFRVADARVKLEHLYPVKLL
jgi:hypothetical protein